MVDGARKGFAARIRMLFAAGSCCRRNSVGFPSQGIRIQRKELAGILAAPERVLDDERRLTLTVVDCPLLAAPLILYRLKRLGYSGCKIWQEPDGLGIRALR